MNRLQPSCTSTLIKIWVSTSSVTVETNKILCLHKKKFTIQHGSFHSWLLEWSKVKPLIYSEDLNWALILYFLNILPSISLLTVSYCEFFLYFNVPNTIAVKCNKMYRMAKSKRAAYGPLTAIQYVLFVHPIPDYLHFSGKAFHKILEHGSVDLGAFNPKTKSINEVGYTGGPAYRKCFSSSQTCSLWLRSGLCAW